MYEKQIECDGCNKRFTIRYAICPEKISCPKCHKYIGIPAPSNSIISDKKGQQIEAHSSGIVIGCPSCHKTISVPADKFGGPFTCIHCHAMTTLPSKKDIDEEQKKQPKHSWLVIKKDDATLSLEGLSAIAKAITSGILLPSDQVVTGPFQPPVSARSLAAAEEDLRKLYDPVGVFSDSCSWALVGLVPAACISLVSTFIEGASPRYGITWLFAIAFIYVASAIITIVNIILVIPIVGIILGGIAFIASAGAAGLAYLLLAIAGFGGMKILQLMREAFRPLAYKIGRLIRLDRKRVSNWEDWMMLSKTRH